MNKNYVLLIDGDNVNYTYLDPFIAYVKEHYGQISEINLFGKLSSSYLNDWKSINSDTIKYNLSDNCKNNTDIQMIHFAWKRFFRDNVHNFIIMSSDADMQAVVADLCSEAEVIIGYNTHKVSAKYLQFLHDRKVVSVDMDQIRGKLSQKEIMTIANKTAKSYLEYKLGNSFFSYDTILDWLKERYPDICSISKEQLVKMLGEFKLSFQANGVSIQAL